MRLFGILSEVGELLMVDIDVNVLKPYVLNGWTIRVLE
jgi:hypothetical protein